MKCARCSREVSRPQDIAGLKLGDRCATIVRAAIVQPLEREQHTEPDPRQEDLFEARSDLFAGVSGACQ